MAKGLLLVGQMFSATMAEAQSSRCAALMSAQQQIKCLLVNGSFAELEAALVTIFMQVSEDEVRTLIESLEYDRSQGNVLAMLGLGVIHDLGVGPVEQDVSKAAGMYLDAAALGSTEGMVRVAMIYCDGRIPAPDMECFFFLRNAAEFGRVDALLVLAEQLVKKADDFDGAKTYLEKAVDLGAPGAEAALRALLQSRT
jgi:TPR repeat protein